ncbi:MAG TPA: hypothetical protein VJT82_01325 [Pyrinomonadaceae bacterium]|nr:hypothetical protein [Pyrinomonadaceae bacterium]
MMNSKTQGFITKTLMLTLVAFLMSPVATFAQDRRDDRRDDRQERREDRREDRQDRREERRERREARRGNNYDRWNWGGSFQLRQTALNAGYNEGIKEGRKDRQRGDRYDFRDESTYQKATKDYSSKLGSRELYQRYLRAAFENGYTDGYNGY